MLVSLLLVSLACFQSSIFRRLWPYKISALITCVTLGKSSNFSVPQLPCMWSRDYYIYHNSPHEQYFICFTYTDSFHPHNDVVKWIPFFTQRTWSSETIMCTRPHHQLMNWDGIPNQTCMVSHHLLLSHNVVA